MLRAAYKTALLSVLLFSSATFAAPPIVITGNHIINTPTTYSNVTLNLENGRFTIQGAGHLTIENSIVNVKISPSNPFFTHIDAGLLTLKDNTFNVTTENITPTPTVQTPYQLIEVDHGTLTMTHNNFAVDQTYSVKLLTTNLSYETNELNITRNVIKNFHGGLYLLNSDKDTISENSFMNVSLSNIYTTGILNEFSENIFSFPGGLSTGNAFDIVNSKFVRVSDNIIASSANFGIHIMGGKNILIDDNKITDGLSYGIFIEKSPTLPLKSATIVPPVSNANIKVFNNYIAQNRYGLSANKVDHLIVKSNIFIQRFEDNISRKFWTNNSHLLTNVDDLSWKDNLYKEAFTQEVPGNNDLTKKFVIFPADGGVSLS